MDPKNGRLAMLAAVAIMNNIPAILAVFLFEIIFPLPRLFKTAIAPDKGLGRFSALGITDFQRGMGAGGLRNAQNRITINIGIILSRCRDGRDTPGPKGA